MCSTEARARLRMAVAGLLVAVTCLSSLSFAPRAKAQPQTREVEPVIDASNVQVAVIGGVFAAYGWLAAKSYDLGREVGKSMVGSDDPAERRALAREAEYLLD